MTEHAVIAYLRLVQDPFGSKDERDAALELAGRLRDIIDAGGIGEFDGEEFGGGRCAFYMYGSDADRLFSAVEPMLRESPFARGGFVIKRYGDARDPNAKEIRIEL